MANLWTIAKATKASAAAFATSIKWGRAIDDAERYIRLCTYRRLTAPPQSLPQIDLEMVVHRAVIEVATKARRAAHRRYMVAQAILAANRLPGDES